MSSTSSPLNRKADALGKVVFRLRQDIDLHRIIGLNVTGLRDAHVSKAFFAHVQQLAHSSVAINFCKIFEHESRNRLSSIPSILKALPDGFPVYHDFEQFKRFALKHGGSLDEASGVAIIRSAYDHTRSKHHSTFQRLRTFRDKIAVHLEFDASFDSLPSHEAFEELWTFANDTYFIIVDQYNQAGPCPMERRVQIGLKRTFEQLRVKSPSLDFPKSA